jgi:DNA-binding Xre family transcriptional regulator
LIKKLTIDEFGEQIKKYIGTELKQKAYQIKIGDNIKQIRISKKISQVELAAKCKFKIPNMSRIESGKNNLTIKSLLTIAKALDENLFYILTP